MDAEVLLDRSTQGKWLVDGDCSWPVGHNCKHVAAVLVQVLEQDWFNDAHVASHDTGATPDAHQTEWQAWLQSAKAEVRKQQAPGAPALLVPSAWGRVPAEPPEFEHFLVLDPCQTKHRHGHWLTLTQGKARNLKNKLGQMGSKVCCPMLMRRRLPRHRGGEPVPTLAQGLHASDQAGATRQRRGIGGGFCSRLGPRRASHDQK